MRKYLIEYYAERNDDCVDFERIVEAKDIMDAIIEFHKKVQIVKRITAITELPYGE